MQKQIQVKSSTPRGQEMIKQFESTHSSYIDVTRRTGWAVEVNFENIPAWMRNLQFGVWTAEPRENGKVNKAPRHPNGGWGLGVNRPEQWATFAQVQKAYSSGKFDGIGVLLTRDTEVVGVDIDDWRSLVSTHTKVFETLIEFIQNGGYVETSPSGAGLRAFVQGSLSGSGRKKGGLEIYDDVRFLTVTGHRREVLDVNTI